MIKTPIQTQRALLIWQQRTQHRSGRRDQCAVGELVQRPDHVSFRYLEDEHLAVAREAGFTEYPSLPIGSEAHNRIAFNVLMRRLPPRSRGDFGAFLGRFGLPADHNCSSLSLLAYTGARLTSDSFSICETFEGFEPPFTYVFDVVGKRHHQEHYADLEENEPLLIQREPDNKHDPKAVRIARANGTTVGYINRWQTEPVIKWLEQGKISATVFRVNSSVEYSRLFVQAEVHSFSENPDR